MPEPIDELRSQIDAKDSEITRLLAERSHIVEKIGVLKKASGADVLVQSREDEVLAKVKAAARAAGCLYGDDDIAAIYDLIFKASRKLEHG